MPMSPLEIEIRSNATTASSSIDSLKTSLEGLKTAVNSVKGLSEISKALEAIGKSKTSFTRIATGLSKLSSSMNGLTDDGLAKMERLATALERIAGTGLTNIPKMPSGKNAETQPEASPVSGEAAGSGTIPTSVGDVSAFSRVRSAIGGITEYLKNANSKLREFFGQLKKDKFSLLNMIPRMAYRRAIMMFFSAIISGAKEGVKALYQYSKVAGTAFAPAYEAMQKTFTVVQNSFGSALGEILMSVMPIIQQFCQLLIGAANLLAQLFAALRGATDWSKAVYGVNAFQKATNGAGKATKELLADIDELNVITSEGGSGGSNSNNLDYGKMFEQATVATWLQERLKTIKAIVVGIGVALLAWKLSKVFKTSLTWLILSIYGVWQMVEGFMDAWSNGIGIDNLGQYLVGATAAIVGMKLAFSGWKKAGVTSVIAGIGLIVVGCKELIEKGELTKESLSAIGYGLSLVAIGAGMFFKTPWLLIIGGLVGLGTAIVTNWDTITAFFSQIGIEANELEMILGGSLLALGAILAFSGASLPIGLALMAAGAFSLGKGIADTDWSSIVEELRGSLGKTTAIVSGATLAIGAILAFSGVNAPLGIAMMAIGASTLATVAALNWDSVTGFVSGAFNSIMTSIGLGGGITLFVLGLILALSGVGLGLGLGLMAIGLGAMGYNIMSVDWNSLWNEAKKGFNTMIAGIVDGWYKVIGAIKSAIKAVKDFFKIKSNEEVMQMMESTANNPQDDPATAAMMEANGLDWWNYPRANGGFVPDGQLFLAREAGAELVGSIGNRTAVANNDQITAGIASAVASANTTGNSLLSQQNAILMQLLNKKTTIEPSAQWGRFNQRCAAMYAGTTG